MSVSFPNGRPNEPKFISLIDADNNREIGRMAGLEWHNVADENGTANPGPHHCQTQSGASVLTIEGPLKKIGVVTGYSGARDEMQQQRIKQLEDHLKKADDRIEELLETDNSLKNFVAALIRMYGGVITISDKELSEAELLVHEEAWDPKTGTTLKIVEQA